MMGALIIIGICYLGLLACGIILLIDTAEAKSLPNKLKNFGKIFGKPIDKLLGMWYNRYRKEQKKGNDKNEQDNLLYPRY